MTFLTITQIFCFAENVFKTLYKFRYTKKLVTDVSFVLGFLQILHLSMSYHISINKYEVFIWTYHHRKCAKTYLKPVLLERGILWHIASVTTLYHRIIGLEFLRNSGFLIHYLLYQSFMATLDLSFFLQKIESKKVAYTNKLLL